jgi:hypothetical protein
VYLLHANATVPENMKTCAIGDTTNMYLSTGYGRLYALFFSGMTLALARADDEIAKTGNTGNPISLLSKVVGVVIIDIVPAAWGST